MPIAEQSLEGQGKLLKYSALVSDWTIDLQSLSYLTLCHTQRWSVIGRASPHSHRFIGEGLKRGPTILTLTVL